MSPEPTNTRAEKNIEFDQKIETLQNEPTTLKERLSMIAFGLVLAGLAASMLIWPELSIFSDDIDPSGGGGRRVAFYVRILDWIWSKPAGIIGVVLGSLFLLLSVLPDKSKKNQSAPSPNAEL